MPLINRVTRLFRSDIHAVLDRMEDPESLLRQAVREMDEDVSQNEQRLKLMNMDYNHNVSLVTDLEQSLQQISDELDICFESDKEDLARSLIKRKLETEKRLKLLNSRQKSLQSDMALLENRLEENHARLAAMKQKLEVLVETAETAHKTDYAGDFCNDYDISVSNDDIEVALLKEKQRRARS